MLEETHFAKDITDIKFRRQDNYQAIKYIFELDHVYIVIMITDLLNPISLFQRASGSASSLLYWILTVTAVISSAFVVYFGFYMLYVPVKEHIKPVHFEFYTHGYSPGFGSGTPQALVNLRDDGIDGDRILSRGQQYIVSVVLHLPQSEVNKDVGMFMTTLKLLSKEKNEIGKVSRSALMPYSSPVVSTLSSLLDFFFLHWRWKRESEKLTIVLFEKFIDDSYHPVEYAQVTVHCDRIQIYSAELRIDAVFSGIRYYMFYWPLSSAMFGISSSIFAGIIIAIWLYSKFWHAYDGDDESEDSFELDDIGFFLGTDTESVATNNEESPLQHDGGPEENEANLQATQRRIVTARRNRGQHLPLRRLVNSEVASYPETESNRRSCVPLTRRVRRTRVSRDQACQTESQFEPSSFGNLTSN